MIDWRAHLTDEERVKITLLDIKITDARDRAKHHTQERETIRRRVSQRVKARIKSENKA